MSASKKRSNSKPSPLTDQQQTDEQTPRELRGFDLQGHRGARGLLPENTLPAFRKALELGVPTLELDVVISADDEVIVSHDPWMSAEICSLPSGEPVPDGEEKTHRLFGMTCEEIARYDCGQRGHPAFPSQQARSAAKPRLTAVIEMAERYCRDAERSPPRYNIETKIRPEWEGRFCPDPETFTQLVYGVVAETGILERAMLQSFDPRTLRVARDLDDSCTLSMLRARPGQRGFIRKLGFTPDVYSPNHRLLMRRSVQAAHRRGMKVVPWTVNTEKRMRRLRRWGVDGLITDYPDMGMQVVG